MSTQAQQAREAFGARLRDLRKDAGLTGRALADLTGWQLSKISKIEHGKQNASENDIHEWCRHSNAVGQIPDLIAMVRHIETMWLEWRRTLQTGVKVRQQRSLSLYQRTKILENNIGNPFAPLCYSISLMYCTTVSLAEGGPGLGAMWGTELAYDMLSSAGFDSIEILDSPRPQSCIYVCRT